MVNSYPLWKYLLILLVCSLGFLYALPNLYPPDPAVLVSYLDAQRDADDKLLDRISRALEGADVEPLSVELAGIQAQVRLADSDTQLRARAAIQRQVANDATAALSLAPTTPDWLSALGGAPMKLGLDLSGGVHFLLEVDTDKALADRANVMLSEIKGRLREERLRYATAVVRPSGDILLDFRRPELRDGAGKLLAGIYNDPLDGAPLFEYQNLDTEVGAGLLMSMTSAATGNIESEAVSQNLTTLRNRVNELGVSEPLVQRQGRRRIVVELPGVQDTAAAKIIIGKTATLEFRLEARYGVSRLSRETFEYRDATRGEAELERRIIITGDRVSSANSAFDENGLPQVNISLNAEGGRLMQRATGDNIGRRLGVLFVESRTRVSYRQTPDGDEEAVEESYTEKKIISLATIQAVLGNSFRITGLESTREASELALLLRAGALAAPMKFVEERTVGPSLGAENVRRGGRSVLVGMLLVVAFMLARYRVFGVAANIALAVNLVLLTAVMSILGATLTLPGILGIVLTMGMAVDANVLIFARIREGLEEGAGPQLAIANGFSRAFVTILDANLTTLLVAVILYAVGTGPVKGFAVTLAVGIFTSIFTAILGTRALVNLIYGGRTLRRLYI